MSYNPKMGELALRDPALAALMGALPGDDFGADPLSGGPFGTDFGRHHGDVSAYDVSRNMGTEFGLSPIMMHLPPSFLHPHQVPQQAISQAHPALQQAWLAQQAQDAASSQREVLLNPNRHSRTKVERYSFSMTQALTLGTGVAVSMTLQPNTTIRPQRVVCNAPSPNFVLLTALQIANVNVFVGQTEDAFTYSSGAMGVMLDLPTLEPAYRATASGTYTGFIPPGFANAFAYTFVLTLQGPAAIAGSAGI